SQCLFNRLKPLLDCVHSSLGRRVQVNVDLLSGAYRLWASAVFAFRVNHIDVDRLAARILACWPRWSLWAGFPFVALWPLGSTGDGLDGAAKLLDAVRNGPDALIGVLLHLFDLSLHGRNLGLDAAVVVRLRGRLRRGLADLRWLVGRGREGRGRLSVAGGLGGAA